MADNIEIKAGVDDMTGLRVRADQLDVRERFRLHQTDTFFNAPHGRLKLREFADGGAELIGYDRPDTTGPKHSRYQKVSIADAAALTEALAMTLGVRGVVRKVRDVLLVGQTRIHLDEVEGLGAFLELEVVMEEGQSHAEGDRVARQLLQQLAIADEALISCAYIDLIDRG